jgi:3-hydroxyacyl-[acyl-carrier-protein] dehydratase
LQKGYLAPKSVALATIVVEANSGVCYSCTIKQRPVTAFAIQFSYSRFWPRQAIVRMRFNQLDRITALENGASISAVKCLSLSEEYLQDHFPRFPVMPGVLMLESMFQASMWLVRSSENFENSTVVLRAAKSLKFQGFVQPGSSLSVLCEIKSKSDSTTKLKVVGSIDGKAAASGRLELASYNLADREDVDPAIDKYMIHQFKTKFQQLWTPITATSA